MSTITTTEGTQICDSRAGRHIGVVEQPAMPADQDRAGRLGSRMS